jgi:hypothetical protein
MKKRGVTKSEAPRSGLGSNQKQGTSLKADPKRKTVVGRIPNAYSGGNLVTHPAVAESAGKFFYVQLLWKAQVDTAGIVENFD